MLQDIRLPVEIPGNLPGISTGCRGLFLVAKNLWLVMRDYVDHKGPYHYVLKRYHQDINGIEENKTKKKKKRKKERKKKRGPKTFYSSLFFAFADRAK